MVGDRNRPLYVAVAGSGEAAGELYEKARKVGRLVAERGGIVVCGGLLGVMEACGPGGDGGGWYDHRDLAGRGSPEGQSLLSYSIVTGTGHARNLAVVCSGDVIIAVGGEYGTLSEIGLALKVGRLVVALGSWDLPGPLSLRRRRRRRSRRRSQP